MIFLVWRNQNAEYKKSQEFENECFRKYEEGGNVCILFVMAYWIYLLNKMNDEDKSYEVVIWISKKDKNQTFRHLILNIQEKKL